MEWNELHRKRTFERPTDKIAYKVPMCQTVVTVRGDFYHYHCTDEGVRWVLFGNYFTE